MITATKKQQKCEPEAPNLGCLGPAATDKVGRAVAGNERQAWADTANADFQGSYHRMGAASVAMPAGVSWRNWRTALGRSGPGELLMDCVCM